jgi:hypothetical protein
MSEILFGKFKYDVNEVDICKRKQSLRNAYIHFGFNELKDILKTLEVSENVINDIAFLEKEEREINA